MWELIAIGVVVVVVLVVMYSKRDIYYEEFPRVSKRFGIPDNDIEKARAWRETLNKLEDGSYGKR